MLKIFLSLALAVALAFPAQADEASVKKEIELKLGGKVTSVTKTNYLGLYEVYADGNIFYTDENISAIFAGSLIDGKTMQNVTAERMQKLSAINFSTLPLQFAIKRVHGNGKRIFATFEDPNCGFCKKLAKEMVKLDNVTVYTFLMPILSQDSLDKSNRIWCSSDRAKAWTDWMIEGKAPEGKDDCDTTAVEKAVEIGRQLKISGTPTLFFTDGTRIPGAVPLEQIEQKLSQTAAAQ
jgi:thiol:disulfide interchange protein DsbC